MSRFFCINSPDVNIETITLLEAACKSRGIEFINIEPVGFDYTKTYNLKKSDLLYNVKGGRVAKAVERFLINEEVTTFYSDFILAMSVVVQGQLYPTMGIPMPKTIYELPLSHEMLHDAVKDLGGLPIILKAMGGSHGVGVMKVDSFSSLVGIVDFFNKMGQRAVLKQFIPTNKSSRLVVLGDEVIDSIEYTASKDDFRTNTGKTPNVKPKKFSADAENIAVRSVHSIGLEFGGVDILVGENGENYVAEMNFPCFFPRCQLLTGVDIAGKMLDYLVKKSNRKEKYEK